MARASNIHRLVRDSRPMPPFDASELALRFEPDQDGLGAWVHRTFIEEGGVLENPRHGHLRHAHIGWLWTNAEHRDRNRVAAGTCQLIPPAQAKWSSQKAIYQLVGWFGQAPDFLITISAPHAAEMDDMSFCALIEHELCHAAQDVDDTGMPRFTREGEPIYRVIGHDVEQFVDVVSRYGADATDTREMVSAANAGASVGMASVAMACGTCAGGRKTA